jgi:hypothetical protein
MIHVLNWLSDTVCPLKIKHFTHISLVCISNTDLVFSMLKTTTNVTYVTCYFSAIAWQISTFTSLCLDIIPILCISKLWHKNFQFDMFFYWHKFKDLLHRATKSWTLWINIQIFNIYAIKNNKKRFLVTKLCYTLGFPSCITSI